MYVEKLKNGKYKFVETYKDFYNNTKRVSITLDKNTKQTQFDAYKIFQLEPRRRKNIYFKLFLLNGRYTKYKTT